MKEKELIKMFIEEVKTEYPMLKMGFEHDDFEDLYIVWHTNKNLEFEDDKFIKFVGNRIKHYFFSNKVYNVTFGYDNEKYIDSLYEVITNATLGGQAEKILLPEGQAVVFNHIGMKSFISQSNCNLAYEEDQKKKLFNIKIPIKKQLDNEEEKGWTQANNQGLNLAA